MASRTLSGALALAAAATATLLVVDAWFDTTTASQGGNFATAVAMALGAELPLAALCGRLALRTLGRSARRRPPEARSTDRIDPSSSGSAVVTLSP